MLFPSRKPETNWVTSLDALYSQNCVYCPPSQRSASFVVNGKVFETLLWYFSLLFSLDCPDTEDSIEEGEIDYLVAYSQLDPPYQSLEQHFGGDREMAKYPSAESIRLFFGLYREAISRFRWFRADGLGNVWVVKGNDSSRGRSIVLVSTLA